MKLCVYCKHFYLDSGSPHYSDQTPGNDAVIECGKGYWKMESYQGTEVFRLNIEKAERCPGFQDENE